MPQEADAIRRWVDVTASTAPSPKPASPRARHVDIDRLKGLAILLVVAGHVTAGKPVPDNRWIEIVTDLIYMFHMPLFMFLSGLVWFMRPKEVGPGYGAYVTNKAQRLLLPFVIFGLFIVVGKLVAVQFVHVDNSPPNLWEGIVSLAWNTKDSPSAGIWYLFTLFTYSIVAPFVLRLTKGAVWPIVVFGAVLSLWKFPEYVYANRLTANLVWFFGAGLVVANLDRIRAFVDRYHPAILMAATGALALYWTPLPDRLLPLLVAPPVTAALFGIVRSFGDGRSKIIDTLAATSFSIYLLNTVAIGVTKAAGLKVVDWGGAVFPLLALAMFTAGVIVPIAVRKLVFEPIPPLERLTR